MSLDKKTKKAIISDYSINKNDTGSVEVSCALITKQIEDLTNHLKTHKKDFSSKRGLLILVGRRKKLLSYLKKSSLERYESLINKLDIRK